MPRPYKDGLDYWQVDVDAHNDGKLKALKILCGSEAMLSWFLLMPEIYRVGCCFRWKELEDKIGLVDNTGYSIEKIEHHVATMIQVRLFDKRIFEQTGFLTSFGIQKRFFSATVRRRKGMELPKGVLLLDPEDYGSKPAIQRESREERGRVERESRGKPTITEIKQTFTELVSAITPLKETLIEESETEDCSTKQPLIQFGEILRMTDEEMQKCIELFGTALVEQEISEADLYLKDGNSKYKTKYLKPTHNHYMFFRVTWLKGKRLRAKPPISNLNPHTKSNFQTYIELKEKEEREAK